MASTHIKILNESKFKILYDNEIYGCKEGPELDLLRWHFKECEYKPNERLFHCPNACRLLLYKNEIKPKMEKFEK